MPLNIRSLLRHTRFDMYLLGCALIIISGCATNPTITSIESRPPSDRLPQHDEGIVVLSMTSNTAQVGQFDTMTIELIESNNNNPKSPKTQFKFRQISRGMARDTALFMGSIKAGDYNIIAFSDEKSFKSLTLRDGGQKLIGSFHVDAGKLSDLGRLVMTPVNFEVYVGRSKRVLSNQSLVERFAAENASIFKAATIAGWNQPPSSSDIFEDFALSHPVGSTAFTELADGQIAAVTRLGTVIVREKNTRWSAIHSGHLESLLWLSPSTSEGTTLYAVGEFNTLLRLDSTSKKLLPLEIGDLPSGNLLFITGDTSSGWYVAHQQADAINIYHCESLDKPQWQKIATETVGMNMWSGMQQFWIWPMRSGFGYAVTKGDIHFFDFDSKTWTHKHAPNNSNLVGVSPSPGDVVGILTSPGGGFAGIFASTYFSRDKGSTWIETKSPFKIKAAPPLVLPDGTLMESGGVFGQAGIQTSQDNGKTWRYLNKENDNTALTNHLWVMPSQGIFKVSNGAQGVEMLAHSDDAGANWELEYTSFDRKLFQAQNPKGDTDKDKNK